MMKCGEKNQADPGWPSKMSHGCGNDMHAVQYKDPAGAAKVALLCPVCDGPGFRK